jgi:hypothetical protein
VKEGVVPFGSLSQIRRHQLERAGGRSLKAQARASMLARRGHVGLVNGWNSVPIARASCRSVSRTEPDLHFRARALDLLDVHADSPRSVLDRRC